MNISTWDRNAELRRRNAEKQLQAQREANFANSAYNAELDRAIVTLSPYIDDLTARLSWEETTTEDKTAILNTYIAAEGLYLQLLEKRKNSMKRTSRSR